MRVSENISLRELNSFGVEARAARLVEWETADELAEVSFDGAWMALGGGNNILFTNDYEGTLIKSAARGIEVTGRGEVVERGGRGAEKVFVRAEAGVDWDGFVAWCGVRGLWGAENLSGIPGTVGAAPIQNIGAYGAEAKDIIVSVECFVTATRNVLTLAAEHCGFGYRDSVFKGELRGKVIVTAVNFALSEEAAPNLGYAALAEKVAAMERAGGDGKQAAAQGGGGAGAGAGAGANAPTLENIRRAVLEIREGKLPDPRVTGNAGSFF